MISTVAMSWLRKAGCSYKAIGMLTGCSASSASKALRENSRERIYRESSDCFGCGARLGDAYLIVSPKLGHYDRLPVNGVRICGSCELAWRFKYHGKAAITLAWTSSLSGERHEVSSFPLFGERKHARMYHELDQDDTSDIFEDLPL